MTQLRSLLILIIMLSSMTLFAQPTSVLLQTSYSAEASGNYQSAIEAMRTLEKNDNSDAFYKLRLGWLYYSSGQYQSAYEYYIKTTTLTNCLEAREGLISAAYMLGKWEKVISTGNQILAKYPDHFSAQTKTAYSYYMTKDYVAAAAIYNKLLTTYPYNLELRGYYLSCQVLAGDLTNAKRTFQQLQQYSPNNPFVLQYADKFK